MRPGFWLPVGRKELTMNSFVHTLSTTLTCALASTLNARSRDLRLLATIVLVAGSTLGTVAMAQDQKPDDSLSGPKVRDNSMPGQTRQFAGGARAKGEPRPLPPRAFVRIVGSLEREDAPEGLALSAGQRTKIEAIREEFESSVQIFRDAHRDELLALRDSVPPQERGRIEGFLRGPEGDRPEGRAGKAGKGDAQRGQNPRGEGRGDGPPREEMMDGDAPRAGKGDRKPREMSPEAKAARERVQEIMQDAPKPEEAQSQVMALLTQPQQEYVKGKLDEVRKMGDAARKGDGDKKAADGEGPRERLMQQLSPDDREKIKGMSPEERRAFIRDKMQLGDKVDKK